MAICRPDRAADLALKGLFLFCFFSRSGFFHGSDLLNRSFFSRSGFLHNSLFHRSFLGGSSFLRNCFFHRNSFFHDSLFRRSFLGGSSFLHNCFFHGSGFLHCQLFRGRSLFHGSGFLHCRLLRRSFLCGGGFLCGAFGCCSLHLRTHHFLLLVNVFPERNYSMSKTYNIFIVCQLVLHQLFSFLLIFLTS